MKYLSVAAVALCAACSMHHTAPAPAPAPSPSPIPEVRGKAVDILALRAIDVAKGTGAPYMAHQCLYVHYTGWLTNGTKFDSSRDTLPNGKIGDPIAFPQGVRRVIVGWDLGFDGMRVGGKRRLLIPYPLAYGDVARPPIPAKSDLIFDIELMAVADTMPQRLQPGVPQCPAWSAVHTPPSE